MCGASSQQEDMYGQQAAFYKEMTAHYTEVYGKEQHILDELTAQFEPILKAGPNQTGFSDEERAVLNTGATEGVARNFAKAKQALGDDLGARGGSDFIPAGGDTQMEERLAATGAAEKSSLENKITMDDFAAGKANWQTAVNALGGIAAQENPNATAGQATGAGTAAADTANQMAMADNSMWSSVIGGLSGVAGAATGAWVNNATKPPGCWIAAAVYDGWGDPRTILVRSYLNNEFKTKWYGRAIMAVYLATGQRVAKYVQQSATLKRIFKPMFDAALRAAQA